MKHKLIGVFVTFIFLMLSSLLVFSHQKLDPDKIVYKTEKTWAVNKGGILKISNCGGDIKAHPAKSNELLVKIEVATDELNEAEAKKLFDKTITFEKTGDDIRIKVECEDIRDEIEHWDCLFDAAVPENYNVDFATGGGDITADSLIGDFEARTGGGDINLTALKGSVSIATGGGDININSQKSGNVEIRTGGGDIKIKETSEEVKIKASTGGGDIRIENVKGMTTLNTGGGDVTVGPLTGEVHINTGGGDIDIKQAKGKVSVNTGGGSITTEGCGDSISANTGGGDVKHIKAEGTIETATGGGNISTEVIKLTEKDAVKLSSGGGDITIYLPKNARMSFDAEIKVHHTSKEYEIKSEFPIKIEKIEDGKKIKIVGTGEANGGGALIRLRTSNSNIYIYKLKK